MDELDSSSFQSVLKHNEARDDELDGSLWDIEPGQGPQNVEDNEQGRTRLRCIDDRTPLRQHDSAWTRLPAQFMLFLLRPPRRIVRTLRESSVARLHVLFNSAFIAVGGFLWRSLSRGDFPLGLFVVESVIAISWTIFSRITRGTN